MIVFVERCQTKKQVEMFEQASLHFADTLMDQKLVDKLTINIELVARCDDDDLGYCQPVALYGRKRKNPREFEVVIKKGKTDTMLRTLAHEFVHVKQFAMNELVYKGTAVTCWKNRLFHDSRTDYWKCPWEKEARDMEDILYESFIASWPAK